MPDLLTRALFATQELFVVVFRCFEKRVVVCRFLEISFVCEIYEP